MKKLLIPSSMVSFGTTRNPSGNIKLTGKRANEIPKAMYAMKINGAESDFISKSDDPPRLKTRISARGQKIVAALKDSCILVPIGSNTVIA